MKKRTYEIELNAPIKLSIESLKSITINGFKMKIISTEENGVDENYGLEPIEKTKSINKD